LQHRKYILQRKETNRIKQKPQGYQYHAPLRV
jgi:hypothetical protein